MTGRWTYRVSAAGVLVLAAAAFTLSYDALHHLALDSRVRPGLAWLWPVVIDGTIVVALLTVLAAKRADIRAGYPWALAGLFSAASVAFNIAHAPDRPVAQLVFAMAPIALVLTNHLLMQQASWRRPTPDHLAAQPADPETAPPHTPADDPAPEQASADRGARALVRSDRLESAVGIRPVRVCGFRAGLLFGPWCGWSGCRPSPTDLLHKQVGGEDQGDGGHGEHQLVDQPVGGVGDVEGDRG